MQILTLQNFSGAQGQSFVLDMGASAITLTLDAIEPLPVRPFPGLRREPFSLVFRSASQVVLPQRLYTLSNPHVGRHDIFLVPVARDHAGVAYQAVFN